MSAFITQTKMIRSASAAAIIVLGLRTLGGAATVALMVFRLSRNSPQCLHFLADANICSEQNGHLMVASGASGGPPWALCVCDPLTWFSLALRVGGTCPVVTGSTSSAWD